jgi:hypothetical protein
MIRTPIPLIALLAVVLAVLAGRAISAPDKYTLQVPQGLAFSEFRGYEDWSVIAISENGGKIAAILGNPAMIDAYRKGVPGNGEPFPDGADGENSLESEKTRGVSRSANGARHSA